MGTRVNTQGQGRKGDNQPRPKLPVQAINRLCTFIPMRPGDEKLSYPYESL